MRLTCPRCGAQYEIAAAAIPAAGREVECSACSHVWFQPGQPKAAAPYDPEARPALNRPLNESILAILRDETARELQARQVDAGKPAPGADQNIANAAAETPPEQAISAPGPSGITETVPAAEEPADEAPAEPVPASTDIPVMADADWPATTLTTAPAGPVAPLAPTAAPDPEPEPEPEPVEPVAEPLPPPRKHSARALRTRPSLQGTRCRAGSGHRGGRAPRTRGRRPARRGRTGRDTDPARPAAGTCTIPRPGNARRGGTGQRRAGA